VVAAASAGGACVTPGVAALPPAALPISARGALLLKVDAAWSPNRLDWATAPPFAYLPVVALRRSAPALVPRAGGTELDISGSGFKGLLGEPGLPLSPVCEFLADDAVVATSPLRVASDELAHCTAPTWPEAEASLTSVRALRVALAGGRARSGALPGALRYMESALVVEAATPYFARAGTELTVRGSGFFLSSAMACGFGQPVVAQTEAYLASPDELVCGVPDLLLGGRDAEWNVSVSLNGVDFSASFATIMVGAAESQAVQRLAAERLGLPAEQGEQAVVVGSVDPALGDLRGGTSLTVRGSGFAKSSTSPTRCRRSVSSSRRTNTRPSPKSPSRRAWWATPCSSICPCRRSWTPRRAQARHAGALPARGPIWPGRGPLAVSVLVQALRGAGGARCRERARARLPRAAALMRAALGASEGELSADEATVGVALVDSHGGTVAAVRFAYEPPIQALAIEPAFFASRGHLVRSVWLGLPGLGRASVPLRDSLYALRGLVDLDALAREQEPHHLDVPVLRRQDERRVPALRGLVHVDVLVREQEPHHLDVTVLRREDERRDPVLQGLVDLDALAREQEPHHLDVTVLRRDYQSAPWPRSARSC
jgi:hypothetical protein